MNRDIYNQNQKNLIINDELSQQGQSYRNYLIQQPEPHHVSQYPLPYPLQYAVQYQYPALPQQQPFYAPAEIALIDPDLLMIRRHNDGYNCGKNKRFGLFITSMSVIQLFFLYTILIQINRHIYYIDFFYKMSTISIFGIIIILLISVRLHKSRTDVIHFILFLAYMALSCFSQFGLILLFDSHVQRQLFVTFDICQLFLMTVAFFYLLIIKKKPNAVVLFIITSIVIASFITYIQYEHYSSPKVENYLIPIVICFLQSCMFKFALQDVYEGKNKIIRKDRILLGFLQFKVFYYIPCIKLMQI